MNKLRNYIAFAILLLAFNEANADGVNRIYVEDASVAAISSGQDITLSVMMESCVDITSFQFDLYLPSDIYVNYNSCGGAVATESHKVTARKGEGFTRVVCYSPQKEVFKARSGEAMKLGLHISGSVGIGNYTISLKDIYFSDAGTPAKGYNVDDTSFILSIEDRILVESITLSGYGTIGVGGELALQATISPDNAYNKELTWSSSNESIAVVDEHGVVTGISMGSVTITATAKDGTGIKATCIITVEDYISFADPNVESICLQYWDKNKDGRISKSEISSVTTLGSYFNKTTAIAQSIRSFDELQYFTGLKTLNKSAFANCINLESITFPSTMTAIEAYALDYCSSLKSLTIPASLTAIADNAIYLYPCNGLKSIVVEEGNTRYDSRDNCNALILTSSNTLILGCENTIIPNTVTSIGKSSFSYCEGLKEINIPGSVTKIDDYAFSGCVNIECLFISSSVASIASTAFSCSIKNSITVETGNTVYDSRENCNALIETNSNTLLLGCKNTVIPNTVTTLGMYAFSGCGDLSTIEIPSSVTAINAQAFSNSGLSAITLPYSLTSIAGAAFYGCTNLKSITIPEQITTIDVNTFKGCTALEYVTLGENVSSIGGGAFNGCVSLKYINIPASLNTVNSIDTKAFTDAKIQEIVICSPQILTYYSNKATSLSVLFGNLEYAPNTCKYVIGDNITSIPSYAFRKCNDMIAVEIPNSVTTIDKGAFMNCTNLPSVEIPSSIISIGKNVFQQCSALTDVTVNWEMPLSISTTDNVFQSVDLSKATLHVPFGTENAYKSRPVWKDFGNIVASRPVATDVSTLSDAIYLESFTVSTATTIEIPINLKNEQTASAYQFDLELPDGVSVAKNAKGKYIASLSDRHDGHTMSSSLIEDNTYRFAVLSFSGDEISGNDGEIIYVTLQVDDDMAGDEYPIYVKNAAYSTPASASVSLPMTTSIVTIEDVTLGDVNKDGKIDIADAVGIVNFILNKASTTFVEKASDVNKDGRTDIADAVAIINIILNK